MISIESFFDSNIKEESAINDNYDTQIVFLCFYLKNNIIYL